MKEFNLEDFIKTKNPINGRYFPLVVTKQFLRDSKKNKAVPIEDYFEHLEIKKGDWCYFWNREGEVKRLYQLHDIDRGMYVSIDKLDDDDLSWFYNCELYVEELKTKIKIDHKSFPWETLHVKDNQ